MVQPIPVIALVRSMLRNQLPPRLSDVDRLKVRDKQKLALYAICSILNQHLMD